MNGVEVVCRGFCTWHWWGYQHLTPSSSSLPGIFSFPVPAARTVVIVAKFHLYRLFVINTNSISSDVSLLVQQKRLTLSSRSVWSENTEQKDVREWGNTVVWCRHRTKRRISHSFCSLLFFWLTAQVELPFKEESLAGGTGAEIYSCNWSVAPKLKWHCVVLAILKYTNTNAEFSFYL